jgi:hypothetical protein
MDTTLLTEYILARWHNMYRTQSGPYNDRLARGPWLWRGLFIKAPAVCAHGGLSVRVVTLKSEYPQGPQLIRESPVRIPALPK